MDKKPTGKKPDGRNSRSPAPERKRRGASDDIVQELRELFSPENLRYRAAELKLRLRSSIRGFGMHVFYSRERIFCGMVCAGIMILLALLQTTIFSAVRPFGAIPDLMISFTLALSVTEGRKWGAVWGMVAAVVIEALSVTDANLLPLLYMPVGFFGGILCRYYFTGSAAVRTVMTLAILPLRGAFTAVYMILSPITATAGEIFFEIVLPEAAATLLLAAPVHLLIYVCLRPFHRTRAEMVSEK